MIALITNPPTRDSGRARLSTSASRQLWVAAWNSRNAASRAAMPTPTTSPVPTSSAVLCGSTSAWYSSGRSIAIRVAWTSAVMSAIGRLPMPATMSIRRDTASRRMTDGVSTVRTSATSPSRTVPPPGRSISRFWMSSMLRRVDGTPCTITSKTFWSSNRLPTWMPWTSVASARRTSPGVMPTAWAFSRSTSISIVDCIGRLDQLGALRHRRHPRRHRDSGWRSARG